MPDYSGGSAQQLRDLDDLTRRLEHVESRLRARYPEENGDGPPEVELARIARGLAGSAYHWHIRADQVMARERRLRLALWASAGAWVAVMVLGGAVCWLHLRS